MVRCEVRACRLQLDRNALAPGEAFRRIVLEEHMADARVRVVRLDDFRRRRRAFLSLATPVVSPHDKNMVRHGKTFLC